MADNYVMRVRAGDTYKLRITYKDPNDVAINLTGYTYLWHIKIGEYAGDYTGSPQITVSTPSTGVILLNLSSVVTRAIATGRGRFFFKVFAPGGVDDTTLLEGGVEVEFNQ